jgi:hypothetical protein
MLGQGALCLTLFSDFPCCYYIDMILGLWGGILIEDIQEQIAK